MTSAPFACSTPARMPYGLGFGWYLWRRHRAGLSLFACTLAIGAVAAHYSTAPLFLALGYVAATFATVFGVGYITIIVSGEGQTIDPCQYTSYLLRLPCRTHELAAWPMAYGACLIAILWTVMWKLILLPLGVHLGMHPSWGRTLLVLLSFMFVTQATLWYPLEPALWKSPILVVTSIAILSAVLMNLPFDFAFLLVIACSIVVSVLGLKRARRGDHVTLHAPWRLASGQRSLPRKPFRAAQRALTWLFFRHDLPVLALLLSYWMLLLVLLVIANFDTPIFQIGLLSLLAGHEIDAGVSVYYAPLFVAGSLLVGSKPTAVKMTFLQPLSNAVLLLARIRYLTLRAILVFVCALLPFVIVLFTPAPFDNQTRPLAVILFDCMNHHAWDALLVLLVASLLFAWKIPMDHLCCAFLPRVAFTVTSYLYFAVGFALTVSGFIVWEHPQLLSQLKVVTPALLLAALVIKLGGGTTFLALALRQHLVRPRELAIAGAMWLSVAALAFAMLSALAPGFIAPWQLATGIVFMMPFARLSASLLVVEWCRHR